MRVEVQHQHAPAEPVVPQRRDRDGDVIHGAEATVACAPRMMEPAEEVQLAARDASRPRPEGGPRRLQRRAAGQADGGHQLLGPHVTRVDGVDAGERLGALQRLEQLGRVHPRQVLVADAHGPANARLGHCPAVQQEPGGEVSPAGVESGARLQVGHGQPVTRVVPEGEVAAEQPPPYLVLDRLDALHPGPGS